MESLKKHLDEISRSYQQIDAKFSENGNVGNLNVVFGLQGKLRESLKGVSNSELDVLLNEIHLARESLSRLQDQVLELRALKECFSAAQSRVAPSGR
ncbi:MAG: hypothetical protein ACE5HC_01550 [Candidatus Binatia bacterium]